MAKLDAAQRKAMPQSEYALPDKRFPVNDKSHAQAALRMKSNASPAEQKEIESKVKSKYPEVGKDDAMSGMLRKGLAKK